MMRVVRIDGTGIIADLIDLRNELHSRANADGQSHMTSDDVDVIEGSIRLTVEAHKLDAVVPALMMAAIMVARKTNLTKEEIDHMIRTVMDAPMETGANTESQPSEAIQ